MEHISSKDKKVENTMNAGGFHEWLGKPKDQPITQADIQKGLASNNAHVRKMAQFAENMQHIKK